ncbi:MAG: AraC family transcriptional regulator [Cyclobacteriaceae bacterium]
MSLQFSISELIYLFAAFHGFFLAGLLLIKKAAKNTIFIVLLVFLFSFYLTENVIYSSGYIRLLPHLYFVTLPLIFLIGPLFYMYIRSGLDSTFRLRLRDMVHLLPFLFELIILLPFYKLSGAIKLSVYESSLQPSGDYSFNIFFLGYLIYIAGTFWYFLASYKRLKNHGLSSASRNRKKVKWLKSASIAFFSYMFLNLVLSLLTWPFPEIIPVFFHTNLICMTVLTHGIGYAVFQSPDLFKELNSNYEFSSMSEERLKELGRELKEVMECDRPYLQSEVSAEDIGRLLTISKHQLSQLLNVGLKTTFYDLINDYRVGHAKKILVSSEYQGAKILHIAFDSGFSNKASFLRNFKKATGMTPTAYKNLHQKQVSIS